MRATGIVRRIDSLGRVVIPKEIRRTMHIGEGDSLEIFVDGEDIIFKKYSNIDELGKNAQGYADSLSKMVDTPVMISDRERIVAISKNVTRVDIVGKSISLEYDKLMQSRKVYTAAKDSVLYPVQNIPVKALVCVPIVSCGDLSGSVVLVDESGEAPHDI